MTTITTATSTTKLNGKAKPAKKATVKNAKSGASSGKKTSASVTAGRAVKAVSKPKSRPLSGMQVIRRCLAENPTMTIAEIEVVLKREGVPKSAGTVAAIVSDFKMVCAALREAGRLKDFN